ncbi:MAG: hypothetical protein IPI45_04435 [Saprospiraceae bacterium]|nr:hypothetical protein [Saprospiraceae bacterium]
MIVKLQLSGSMYSGPENCRLPVGVQITVVGWAKQTTRTALEDTSNGLP